MSLKQWLQSRKIKKILALYDSGKRAYEIARIMNTPEHEVKYIIQQGKHK